MPIQWLASPAGRIARIVAGILLILLGFFVVEGTAGVILAVVGLAPLIAGVMDICLFAPLFKLPLSGKAIRSHQ